MSKRVQENTDGLEGAVNSIRVTQGQLTTLQAGLGKTNSTVDLLRSNLQDNLESTAMARAIADRATEGVSHLREGYQVTNNNVHILKEELRKRSEDLESLSKTVSQMAEIDIVLLKEQDDKLAMTCEQLRKGVEANTKELWSHGEQLQKLKGSSKKAKEDILQLREDVKSNSTDLGNLKAKVHEEHNNLETTNAVVMKMHELLETAQGDIANLRDGVQTVNAKHLKLFEHHGSTAKDAQTVHQALEKLSAAHSVTHQRLHSSVLQLNELQNEHAKALSRLEALGGQLDTVHSLASKTQENLRVTNAYVLPNLAPGLDVGHGAGGAANSAEILHGSATVRGTMASTTASRTPRKKKDGAWISRNIGIVPDRMSWI